MHFLENLRNLALKLLELIDSYHKIYQLTVFTLILYGVAVRCDRIRFSVLSQLIKVYGWCITGMLVYNRYFGI